MTRAMKDSGIDWISEIPEDWSIAPIGHLYSERKQKVSDTIYKPLSVTKQGIVPQLDSAAKSDAHDDRKLVCVGDFAINSRSDRRGSCGISDYEGSISLINTVLRPKTTMTPKYFDWLFHTTMFADEFYKWGHGIVDDLWTTNWSDMKKIMVALPSMPEQQKIADFLDEKCSHIDSVLEKTRASIEEYKQLKQSVITNAVTKGIRPNRPMKDSGIEWIGQIPEDWEKIKLKYVTTISRGLFNHRPRNDERYYNGNYPFIQTGDVARAQKYITTYTQTLNELGKSVSKMFPKGTMTMTIAANIGDVAILGFDAYFPDSLVGFKIKEQFTENYVYYILRALKEQFMITAVANTQLNLNIERIKDVFVHVTYNKMEQEKIANYLDDKCAEIDKLITKKEQLIEELETYKKSLIYEYVTGKKEVC